MRASLESSAKKRFPREVALGVVRELLPVLRPVCERLIVAGSLRRMKEDVGDVEILYVPRYADAADGELFARPRNLADAAIDAMLRGFVLRKRTNAKGSEMFGPKNKLVQHVLSGVPVDLFEATAETWCNYLVCRTGPASSNLRVATAARERGYRWSPYGPGYVRLSDGETIPMESEDAVFAFVGLPCPEPKDRS